MTAQPVRLRNPSRRLTIETLGIRGKLSGPIWRLLSRSERPVYVPEGSPGGIAVVEVEEGEDVAFILTGPRWYQLRNYITSLEDRLAGREAEARRDA